MMSVLKRARESGVVLSLSGAKIKLNSATTKLPLDLVTSLRLHKEEIRRHLIFIQSMKRYSIVRCPNGELGSVWEIYESMQRVGVLFPNETWPIFYYFEEFAGQQKYVEQDIETRLIDSRRKK